MSGAFDSISSIITSLGVDSTLFAQFIIVFAVYLVLSNLLFKPYMAAYVERKRRTEGGQDNAQRVVAETEQLETTYEQKAREINVQFKKVYDKTRSEALHEYTRLVEDARTKAHSYLDQQRAMIDQELEKARKELSAQSPVVANAIVSKLLGKEPSV